MFLKLKDRVVNSRLTSGLQLSSTRYGEVMFFVDLSSMYLVFTSWCGYLGALVWFGWVRLWSHRSGNCKSHHDGKTVFLCIISQS